MEVETINKSKVRHNSIEKQTTTNPNQTQKQTKNYQNNGDSAADLPHKLNPRFFCSLSQATWLIGHHTFEECLEKSAAHAMFSI